MTAEERIARYGFDWETLASFGEYDFQEFYEKVIAKAPPNATLVEIGCYCGRSLIHMGLVAKERKIGLKVFGIDMHSRNIPETIKKANLEDTVTFIESDSVKAAELFKDNSCWFIYVDGAHTPHEAVEADARAWMPKLTDDGIFAGHDIHWYVVIEPVMAILEDVYWHPEHVWRTHKQEPKVGVDIHKKTSIDELKKSDW